MWNSSVFSVDDRDYHRLNITFQLRNHAMLNRYIRAGIAVTALAIVSTFTASSALAETPSCSPDAVKTAIAGTTAKLNALNLTGNPDKDFGATSMALMAALKNLSRWEIRCGNNPKMQQTAQNMIQSIQTYDTALLGGQ